MKDLTVDKTVIRDRYVGSYQYFMVLLTGSSATYIHRYEQDGPTLRTLSGLSCLKKPEGRVIFADLSLVPHKLTRIKNTPRRKGRDKNLEKKLTK